MKTIFLNPVWGLLILIFLWLLVLDLLTFHFPFYPPLPIEYANIDWNDEGFLEANGDRRLLK